MDERRDRRGSGHGVGQPGVQHELARLRHHGDRETGRSHHECGVAHTALEDVLVDRDRVEGHSLAGGEEQRDHADEKADIADTVGDEGLQRSVAVGLLLPPVTDQGERTHADEFPADDHLENVVTEDEEQHRGGEQRQEREEVRVAAIAADVIRRVDVHQQRDHRDDEQHHHAEAVDHDAGVELHTAGLQPLGGLLHGHIGLTIAVSRFRGSAHGKGDVVDGGTCAVVDKDCGLLAIRVEREVVAVVHPGRAGEDREDEADGDSRDAEFGALEGHLLAEEEDEDERDRRQQGDQPRVLEEPVGLVGDGGDFGNRAGGEMRKHGLLSPSAGRPG